MADTVLQEMVLSPPQVEWGDIVVGVGGEPWNDSLVVGIWPADQIEPITLQGRVTRFTMRDPYHPVGDWFINYNNSEPLTILRAIPVQN